MSICMCSSLKDCGLKNECYRFRKEPSIMQPWADLYKEGHNVVYNKHMCIHFIPIEDSTNLRK